MCRILIADDDASIRRLLQRVLQAQGYTVEVAADGRAAWQRIQEVSPDLLLLDLMMPVMNGWELYAALRGDGHKHLPIVVLTAGGKLDRARQELPDTDVLGKPFDLDHLLSTIQRCLGPKKPVYGPFGTLQPAF